MCGIVGFIGTRQAAPLLLEGLKRLEYRGYDSAGIAVRGDDGPIQVVRAEGRLQGLIDMTQNGQALSGTCGIGHTRWATHGKPSAENAHPHSSSSLSVVGVHNGIIENYQEFRDKLRREGYTFSSETDTETAVNLVDYYYRSAQGDPLLALSQAMMRIRGSYALALMFRDHPGEIYVARKDSPLVLGVSGEESYLASDVPAILNSTRSIYYIGNLQMARVTPGEIHFYNTDLEEISLDPVEIQWDADAAERGGFAHFMMKEIHEQPRAVADTIHAALQDGVLLPERLGLTPEILAETSQVVFVGCGSAYHVGVAAQYILEDLAGIPARVELASEFRYRRLLLPPNALVVIISQSGETADSLAALREAKKRGAKTLALVNVVGSSIARESDHVFYTLAGPEIAVATTKAYSTQLAAAYLLSLAFAQARNTLPPEELARYFRALEALPGKILRILEDQARIQWFAAKHAAARDIFFIGRGLDYAICMEGSLKTKEISYIHSEAYAAGELKHGTISLIEPGTLVVGVLAQPCLYEKALSNLAEVKSRGAYLMGLTPAGNYDVEDTVDFAVYIPAVDPHFAPSLAAVPLQLLGYYISVAKGLDVDKPRNLAKSVTVE